MKLLFAVALGGAVGAVARYQTMVWVSRWLGSGFPFGTLFVNVAGSFLMGLFIELLAVRLGGTLQWRAFVAVGVLGAFTTFSTFALDVAVLYERGQLLAVGAYLAASVALSILALFAGLWTLRNLLT